MGELTQAQKMHRRAQKAEGELQRMKAAFQTAVHYSLLPNSDRYSTCGWMLLHMPPFMHLITPTKPNGAENG
jgi:hypothetical protein